MKKILTSLPFRLLCLLCTVVCICALLRSALSISLVYTPAAYGESRDILANPYCGFYKIYGYTLSDNSAARIIDPSSISRDTGNSRRLVMIQINLKNFQNSSLTNTALNQLENILSAWAQTDKHFILRFLYDWDGKAEDTEPEDMEIILQHMRQTASVYNKYADRIYIIQGLYTGNYGEMHHSHHESSEDMIRLASVLADVSDPSVYLAVRTPAHWRTITGCTEPADAASASAGSLARRLGLFNDGILSSVSDAGTYADGERESELLFQNRLCQNVPNGGEVIIDNPRNNLTETVKDLRTMHVSYLNEDYDPNVLNKWKNSTYEEQDIFEGCSGYDYIAAHLGYRYVLRSSEISFSESFSKTATLSLAIENTGFSNSYYPFRFTVTLINRDTKQSISLASDKDSSFLRCGTTNTIDFTLNVRDYAPGTYDIYFLTLDAASEEAIQYANTMTMTEDGYPIGSLSINK